MRSRRPIGGWLFLGAIAVLIVLAVHDHFANISTSTPVPTQPSSHYVLVRVQCADGWQSPSIGSRGACSYHGGEVSIWSNQDQGYLVQCARGNDPYYGTCLRLGQ